MKKLVTILLVVLSISFVGCSSDDSSNSTGSDEIYLNFTYEGQNYNFEPSTGTSLRKAIIGTEDVNDVNTTLSLDLPKFPSVGTFNISDATITDDNINTLHAASFFKENDAYDGISGTLKITSITDEYIIGTFNFIGENYDGVTVEIINGSFKAYN